MLQLGKLPGVGAFSICGGGSTQKKTKPSLAQLNVSSGGLVFEDYGGPKSFQIAPGSPRATQKRAKRARRDPKKGRERERTEPRAGRSAARPAKNAQKTRKASQGGAQEAPTRPGGHRTYRKPPCCLHHRGATANTGTAADIALLIRNFTSTRFYNLFLYTVDAQKRLGSSSTYTNTLILIIRECQADAIDGVLFFFVACEGV